MTAILLLDEIELPFEQLQPVLDASKSLYQPEISQLGLELKNTWISPPAAIANKPNTLWLQWQLPDDIWSFWGLRAAQTDAMIEFWQLVDSLCLSRKRHTLCTGPNQMALPTENHHATVSVDESILESFPEASLLKKNETNYWSGQLSLSNPEDAHRIQKQLLSLSDSIGDVRCAKNLEGSVGAGDLTFDLCTIDGNSNADRLVDKLSGVKNSDLVRYQRLALGVGQPDVTNGIWRTLMLRVKSGTSDEQLQQWLQANLAMPWYLGGIKNWCLGRVVSDSYWTHIWQQEFGSIDDLQGEYMQSAFHWGWVDHWFDVEHPDCIVEARLSHAFCPFEESLLGHEPVV